MCIFMFCFFFSEEIHKSQKAVIADDRYSFIYYHLIDKIYPCMLEQTFCLGAFYKFIELLCMYNCTKYTFDAFNSSLQILISWAYLKEHYTYVLIGKIFFCILQDVLRCHIIQFLVFFCIWCGGS